MAYQKSFWIIFLGISIFRSILYYSTHNTDYKTCKYPIGLWQCIEFSSITVVLILNIIGHISHQQGYSRNCRNLFLIVTPLLQFINLLWTIIGTYWIIYTLTRERYCLPESGKPYQLAVTLVSYYIYWSITSCSVALLGILMIMNYQQRIIGMDLINLDTNQSRRNTRLTQDQIQTIKTELLDECMTCSICLEIVDPGVEVRVLPLCMHKFHCECIDQWLKRNAMCPYCRRHVSIDAISVA
ncbi:unnamed protein product [Blepharisma stoltei]|uniref:RING-type domain-containing protein n=1 Tax=Blepharisma stoltei TaxID=1481888 RepID=A0AAU9IAL4_9CILI|nr:unnamed protein product [Blepharisma stoltei]